MIMEETMSGRMSSLSILISRSPGKEMSMMVSPVGSTDRSAKPRIAPSTTPTTVSTSSRLVRHHDNTYKNTSSAITSVRHKLLNVSRMFVRQHNTPAT